MIQDETVKKLTQICTPRSFSAQEYICYEGQPGNEMYIILRGNVGIYVSSAIDTQVEISRMSAGDLFGEMSIFDDLPRSASCIALDDVICVAIDKSRKLEFISKCPEMALKLLENLSVRIRKLDNALYKSDKFVQNKKLRSFEIPAEYGCSHNVEEPPHDLKFTESVTAECPICGKPVTVLNLKKQLMRQKSGSPDGRIRYVECDPLWYDVWSCPYCHYSNHHLSFFRMLPFKKELIKKVLEEQHDPVLKAHSEFKTPFDHLVLRYLRAIHVNEAINSEDHLLTGRLWLNLYWLLQDAGDEKMKLYCADKASALLYEAITGRETEDAYALQSLSLSAANLYAALGNKGQAKEMCGRVIDGEDGALKKLGYLLRDSL
ncbi:MAG: DUF2225 domain-containing protein [Firmicutes bacterium]|nr:DUF2225 domain-containing protein [[Eubacterium] siraeum]MCM1488141.1 DUF2225 domain-containing protein [Bacillota bacterium]